MSEFFLTFDGLVEKPTGQTEMSGERKADAEHRAEESSLHTEEAPGLCYVELPARHL